jgi:hypothetical protein
VLTVVDIARRAGGLRGGHVDIAVHATLHIGNSAGRIAENFVESSVTAQTLS